MLGAVNKSYPEWVKLIDEGVKDEQGNVQQVSRQKLKAVHDQPAMSVRQYKKELYN